MIISKLVRNAQVNKCANCNAIVKLEYMITDIELFHSECNIYKSGSCYSLAFAKNLQIL